MIESASPDEVPSSAEFDPIAAADEIETDLGSLAEFETQPNDGVVFMGFKESPEDLNDLEEHVPEDIATDNVVPLHPDMPESSRAAEAKAPRQTDWVSLPAAPAEKPAINAADPWAHMRPSEEPKKKGFWANRPRFFGGAERRQARAERQQAELAELAELDEKLGITFDKECPNCGDECQVDMDDPVARRVHVSCPSCQHIWYTPYVLEESQTG